MRREQAEGEGGGWTLPGSFYARILGPCPFGTSRVCRLESFSSPQAGTAPGRRRPMRAILAAVRPGTGF
eukprot:8088797-Pyramimonas_sp.AAC.1